MGPVAFEPLPESEPEPAPQPESGSSSMPEPVALETQPAPDVRPAPTHRVLYSFTAEHSWGLSVEAGQEVILLRSANGWAQIQLWADPTAMGGVPEEYLKRIAEPEPLKFDAFDSSELPA